MRSDTPLVIFLAAVLAIAIAVGLAQIVEHFITPIWSAP